MVEEWNQAVLPLMSPTCPSGQPRIWVDGSGEQHIMACSSTGIIYPPSIALGILAELLFPDSWSIIPPG